MTLQNFNPLHLSVKFDHSYWSEKSVSWSFHQVGTRNYLFNYLEAKCGWGLAQQWSKNWSKATPLKRDGDRKYGWTSKDKMQRMRCCVPITGWLKYDVTIRCLSDPVNATAQLFFSLYFCLDDCLRKIVQMTGFPNFFWRWRTQTLNLSVLVGSADPKTTTMFPGVTVNKSFSSSFFSRLLDSNDQLWNRVIFVAAFDPRLENIWWSNRSVFPIQTFWQSASFLLSRVLGVCCILIF